MNIVLLILFLAVFADCVWTLIDPARAIRFRKRFGLPENLVTGIVFYSTPRRARVAASLVLTLSLLGIVEHVTRIAG